MKVLVTGGAGYIGSCTVEYLLNNGDEVVVLDSLCRGNRKATDSRARLIVGDLADDDIIDNLMQEKFDGIVHLAALVEARESIDKPELYFHNNVDGGVHLLAAAVRTGVKKIVFASTAEVYGEVIYGKINEKHPKKPINAYGESKLMFEHMLKWYYNIHGLKYIALRLFNPAGATENCGECRPVQTHLIPKLIEIAMGKKNEFKMFGADYPTHDGTCVRDYVHIKDVVHAIKLALQSNEIGSFNIGLGQGHSVLDIKAMVKEISGEKIPAVPGGRRLGDATCLISDSSLAYEKLGWKPKITNVKQIVEDAWNWMQKNPNCYK